MIIWRLTFNPLGAALSTLYLCMKFPLPNGRVGVIQRDQEFSIKCYAESLEFKRTCPSCRKARRMNSGVKPQKEFRKGEETSYLTIK